MAYNATGVDGFFPPDLAEPYLSSEGKLINSKTEIDDGAGSHSFGLHCLPCV